MTWGPRSRLERIAVVVTAFAFACGDDGENGPVANPASIQVSLNPTALSVEQGGSGSLTASLTRGGGFNGVVSLAVTGLPSGLTTTVTPTQLSGTTTSASVSVTAAVAVTAQIYTATVTATAENVAQATTTFQVIVSAAPNYALSAAPATLAITAGASAVTMITIDRTNFTGEVALSLLNPPGGITGTFSPTPSTASTSSLSLRVETNVAPGNYPITIQGTAAGRPGTKTTTLALTVMAPPAGGTNVEFQYCDAAETPVFFAYQDGTGAWQPVTGSRSGGTTTFAFKLTQIHGGVLAVYRIASASVASASSFGSRANVQRLPMRSSRTRELMRRRMGVPASEPRALARSALADAYVTEVLYASATELAQDGKDDCALWQPPKTITATVTGVTDGQYGILSLGGASELFIGGTSTNPVTFTNVRGGPVDFVATRMTSPGTPPDKAILLRNLNIADGGSLPTTVDFTAPAPITPATGIASITGSGIDELEIFTELITANGPSLFWFDLAPSMNAARPWAGIPSSAMVSGDFHAVVVFATGTASGRVSLKYVGPVANQTIVLGPRIEAPAVTQVVAGAYPRFRFQGTLPEDYASGASIDVASTLDSGNAFFMVASGTYITSFGKGLAYDFTMPDVAGLPGFPVASRLTAAVNDVSASGFAIVGTGIFDVQPTVGSEFKGGTRRFTLTVP
jgi:hypothetical protein